MKLRTHRDGGAGQVAGRHRRGRRRRAPGTSAILFLLPALVLLIAFRLAPIAGVVRDSTMAGGEFVGLENFRFLFGSDVFLDSLRVTAIFNLVVNPLQIAIALGISLVVVDGAWRPGLWRTLNLLPVSVPVAVSAIVWGVIMRPDGLANGALRSVGLPAQPWLTSPDQALWAIAIIVTWVGVGYWSIFLIAGLHEIPGDVLEAASIDGSGYWSTLLHIRLPMMRRTLAFVLIANTVINLLLFAPVQILTRGGPSGSTNLVMYENFRTAFIFGDLSLAAAQTVVVVAVVMMVAAVQFRLMRSAENR